MSTSLLRPLLAQLPERHRRALEWFDDRAGQEIKWPSVLPDGTFLATKAKGIYKPAWTHYALSVRQTLDGPYPDREVKHGTDGSWLFEYFQERIEPGERDLAYTNLGLLECLRDVVPVAVFVQTRAKPHSRYQVLGLALVAGYDSGYYRLEGAAAVALNMAGLPSVVTAERADFVADAFSASGIEDERIKTLQLINQRRGQAGFRRTLLDAYGRRCSVTGYEAVEALEGAHIMPYRGPVTNHPSNGLLLRADIHTLFDLGLVAVDYKAKQFLLSEELRATRYGALADRGMTFPVDERLHPSREALEWHRDKSGL